MYHTAWLNLPCTPIPQVFMAVEEIGSRLADGRLQVRVGWEEWGAGGKAVGRQTKSSRGGKGWGGGRGGAVHLDGLQGQGEWRCTDGRLQVRGIKSKSAGKRGGNSTGSSSSTHCDSGGGKAGRGGAHGRAGRAQGEWRCADGRLQVRSSDAVVG